MEQNTVSRAYTIQDRAGKPGGGKGFLIQDNICGTLGTSCGGDRAVIMVMKNENNPVAYGICSMDSNSMKSSNPHSGFYEAETSRTLDLNGGNPGCNQGGGNYCYETEG